MMFKRIFVTIILLSLCCFGNGYAIADSDAGFTDFQDKNDGTILDRKTGFLWMKCAMGQKWDGTACQGAATRYNYDQATKLTANFAGKGNWRLPNIHELQTLLERKNRMPAIDTGFFPNTPSEMFWSSTLVAGNTVNGWTADFYNGGVLFGKSTSEFLFVRLISTERSFDAGPRDVDFIPDADGVIKDQLTGLVWMRCPVGQTWSGDSCTGNAARYTWDQAKVLTDNYAGYNDWRLPSAVELSTLVNYSSASPGPTINIQAFPNAFSDVFRSSTGNIVSADYPWFVDFSNGSVDYNHGASDTFPVRLVSSGKSLKLGNFDSRTGVSAGDKVSSNIVIIEGTGTSQYLLSIQNGRYSLNGSAFTDQPGVARVGDALQLQVTASDQYLTEMLAVVTIGDVTSRFSVTTMPEPVDNTPDPFHFKASEGNEPNEIVLSEMIVLSGLSTTPISIQGGFYSINEGIFTTQPGTVRNGDKIQIRAFSASTPDTQVNVSITVGSYTDIFAVKTRPAIIPDSTPDPFAFKDQTAAELSKVYYSDTIKVKGFNQILPVSITGGEYSIEGGPFTSTAGTIKEGNSVQIKLTTSSQFLTAANAVLTIGSVSDTYTVTTRGKCKPDGLVFTAKTDAGLSTLVDIGPVKLTGINPGCSVKIVGGTYSLNNAAFTNQPGIVNPNDQLRVRILTSDQLSTISKATVTIGTDAFVAQATTVATVPWRKIPAPTSMQPSASGGVSYGQSLATNGNQLWVGAPLADSGTKKTRGLVYIWEKSTTGAWKESGAALSFGESGDAFGASLALGNNWAFVGAPGASQQSGMVWAYSMASTAWKDQSPVPLRPNTTKPKTYSGSSMAVSGNWLAVGAPGSSREIHRTATNGDGEVHLFFLESGIWKYKQTLVSGKPSGRFGASVALDGSNLIIGAPTEATCEPQCTGTETGRLYVYRLNGSNWQKLDVKQPSRNDIVNGHFAESLALSGNSLIVGAPKYSYTDDFGKTPRPEAGRIFRYGWDETSKTWKPDLAWLETPSEYRTTKDRFGSSLALADSGRLLLVGAPGADQIASEGTKKDIGRVYLYQANTSFALSLIQVFKIPDSTGLGSVLALTPTTAWMSTFNTGMVLRFDSK